MVYLLTALFKVKYLLNVVPEDQLLELWSLVIVYTSTLTEAVIVKVLIT